MFNVNFSSPLCCRVAPITAASARVPSKTAGEGLLLTAGQVGGGRGGRERGGVPTTWGVPFHCTLKNVRSQQDGHVMQYCEHL